MKKILTICAMTLLFACNENNEVESSKIPDSSIEIKAKGSSTISEEELAKFPESAQLIYRHNQNLMVMEKKEAEKIFIDQCTKLLDKKGISSRGLSDHEIITKVLALKN